MEYPRETTFHFSAEGIKTKKKYEGDFTVKTALTVGEQIAVGIAQDRYNGGSSTIDFAFSRFNQAMAALEQRIIVRESKALAPEWFRDSDYGRKLLDANVVLELEKMAIAKSDEAFSKALDTQIKAAEAAAASVTK
jgi:hypothetical protein